MLRVSHRPHRLLAFGIVFGCLIAPLDTANAQTPPAGATNSLRPSERRLEPPVLGPEMPAPRFELPPVQVPGERAPLSEGPSFVLRGVRFVGNTVFNDKQLSKVVESYIGQRITTEDLQDIRHKLSRVYINAGFINSGALVPDQHVENGVVTITVVEGRLSEIDVDGLVHIHPDYIQSRVRLGTGPPLNIRELQERIQILLQDPLVQRVDVRLGRGARLGDAKLQVDVKEEKRFDARLAFSNGRPPSVGSFEGRADLGARNLTGWGDAHQLTYARTAGLENVALRTGIPISPWDTWISFRISDSESEVVEQPFNIIDVESQSRDYELSIAHPVFWTPSQKLTLGIEFAHRESETFLLGVPFSFSPGPANGVSKVRVFRFVQEWLERDRDHVFAIRSSFNRGIDVFGATTSPPPTPDGRFFSWLGQAQYVRRVIDDHQIIVRAEGQFTPDRLLPLEKYSVGGVASVRGYRENQLVKDQGFALSIEGRIPIAKLPISWIGENPQDGQILLAPFFDFGRAWDRNTDNIDSTKIYSAGIGLLWRISENVDASVYFAHPFREISTSNGESLQDDGVHFRFSIGLL